MDKKPDIYKAAAIIIKDRQLLATKSHKHDIYLSPGGKIEVGETPAQALVRELKEELTIDLDQQDFYHWQTIEAPASNDASKLLKMEVFFVTNWRGELTAANEIGELKWVDSSSGPETLGSVIVESIIPRLVKENLID